MKQFEDLGLDMDACLDSLVIKSIEEVDKQERAEMVKETMAAEGVAHDQDNKITGLGDASACTGATSNSTIGTGAKAMGTMNAKETVVEEKKKYATVQYEATVWCTKLEQIRRKQL